MTPTVERARRTALYYPYIHIRSEHWLKATLLYSPAVTRIVPEAYLPEDEPSIARYVEISGTSGNLLQSVPAWSDAANLAQQRLLRKIENNIPVIQGLYGRLQSPVADEYWIHEAKFNGNLLHTLQVYGLAWPGENLQGYGSRTWVALHPVLGSAIMTTLGFPLGLEH